MHTYIHINGIKLPLDLSLFSDKLESHLAQQNKEVKTFHVVKELDKYIYPNRFVNILCRRKPEYLEKIPWLMAKRLRLRWRDGILKHVISVMLFIRHTKFSRASFFCQQGGNIFAEIATATSISAR